LIKFIAGNGSIFN